MNMSHQSSESHDIEVNLAHRSPEPVIIHTRSTISSIHPTKSSTDAGTHELTNISHILFFERCQNYYKATFHIKNTDPCEDAIIFKIKTTSPKAYSATPIVGIVCSNGEGKVTIKSQDCRPAECILRDTFEIQVCRIPVEMGLVAYQENAVLIDPNANADVVKTAFRDIAAISQVESYILKTAVHPRPDDESLLRCICCPPFLQNEGQPLDLPPQDSTGTADEPKYPITIAEGLLMLIALLLCVLLFVSYLIWNRQSILMNQQSRCTPSNQQMTFLDNSSGHKESAFGSENIVQGVRTIWTQIWEFFCGAQNSMKMRTMEIK